MSITRAPHLSRSRRQSVGAILDTLETRTLLSALVTHDTFDGYYPIVGDGAGNVYAIQTNVGLAKISGNADGTLNVQSFPNSLSLGGLAYNHADNTLWAGSDFSPATLYQFDASGNVINAVNAPAGSQYYTDDDEVTSVTIGSDNAIWFTTLGFTPNNTSTNDNTSVSEIGRYDLGTGTITLTALPQGTAVQALQAAPDGSLWTTTQLETESFANDAYSASSAVAQVKWNGSAIQVTSYNIADSANQLTNPVVVSANDGHTGDYSVWFASSAFILAPHSLFPFDGVNWAGGSDLYPNLPGQLDHLTVTNGVVPVSGAQTQLVTTNTTLPAGVHSALVPEMLAVDSSGTLWLPEADQEDIADTFANGPVQNPVVNALDSFDTTTGDFNRITLGESQPLLVTVSGSTLWVDAFPSLDFSQPGDLDTLDLNAAAGNIGATDPGLVATTNQPDTDSIVAFASSDAGDFSYSIDYGNGTTGTGTVTNDGSGLFYIPASVTYAAAGNYDLSVTIVSATGDVTTVHGTAVVTDAVASIPLAAQGLPAISGQKDVALLPNVSGQGTLVVAQFTGAPDSYSATINWGDNTPSIAGTIVSLGGNQYAVELAAGQTKTYNSLGSFNISVSITDNTQPATVSAVTVVNISAVPVVASQNLVLKPLLGPIVLGSVATFTADPLANASWFKATIHWGDGTTSTGLVIRDSAGHFEVIGLHLYSKKGTYTVTTNIIDSVDAETALATATIKVTSVL